MEKNLFLIWQPVPGGARLIRAVGETPCPILPDTLGGLPITEIGPYCFSPREPACEGTLFVNEGAAYPSLSAAVDALPGRVLSGNFLQCVTLPASVTLLHNAAFYNCRKLERLHLGAEIRRVGSDCFTNCFALETVRIAAAPNTATCLPKIAASIEAAFTGEFYHEGRVLARVHFPEYADDNYENGPTHIFAHAFQGVGYMFRQCFGQDNVWRPGEFDACFDRALSQETELNLVQIGFERLRYPLGLSEVNRSAYALYCREHGDVLSRWLVEHRDDAGLDVACRDGLLTADVIARAAALAAKLDQPKTAALLLNWQRQKAAPVKKSYDF